MDERELKEIDLLEIYMKNLTNDLASQSIDLFVAKIEAENIIRKLNKIILQEDSDSSKGIELITKVQKLLTKINHDIQTNEEYTNIEI